METTTTKTTAPLGNIESVSLFVADWIEIETALHERATILYRTGMHNQERGKEDKAEAQFLEAELCEKLARGVARVIDKNQEEELF